MVGTDCVALRLAAQKFEELTNLVDEDTGDPDLVARSRQQPKQYVLALAHNLAIADEATECKTLLE